MRHRNSCSAQYSMIDHIDHAVATSVRRDDCLHIPVPLPAVESADA